MSLSVNYFINVKLFFCQFKFYCTLHFLKVIFNNININSIDYGIKYSIINISSNNQFNINVLKLNKVVLYKIKNILYIFKKNYFL